MNGITFNAAVSAYPISNPASHGINADKESASANSRYDEVFISEESRKRFLALQEQTKLEFAKSLPDPRDIDLLENEFQILGVKYTFQTGTLEQFLSEKLEGKAKNASLVASEIAENIRGAVSNPNATVEERAVNRKTALKLAEEIAQNYFDNADEAESFLSEINKYAENDVLREQGYVVFDNSDMKPFKEYTLPTAPENYVRGSAFAEKYGDTNLGEIFNDSAKFEDFVHALQKNGEKWREDIVKDFDDRKRRVQERIDKSSLSQLNEQHIQNIISTFFK